MNDPQVVLRIPEFVQKQTDSFKAADVSRAASGTNYTSGGAALTNVTPTTSGTTAFCDFNDLTFGTATITARGCMIYNSSDSNKSVATIDFGGDKTSTAGDFTIVFPAAASGTAIIRIA